MRDQRVVGKYCWDFAREGILEIDIGEKAAVIGFNAPLPPPQADSAARSGLPPTATGGSGPVSEVPCTRHGTQTKRWFNVYPI